MPRSIDRAAFPAHGDARRRCASLETRCYSDCSIDPDCEPLSSPVAVTAVIDGGSPPSARKADSACFGKRYLIMVTILLMVWLIGHGSARACAASACVFRRGSVRTSRRDKTLGLFQNVRAAGLVAPDILVNCARYLVRSRLRAIAHAAIPGSRDHWPWVSAPWVCGVVACVWCARGRAGQCRHSALQLVPAGSQPI